MSVATTRRHRPAIAGATLLLAVAGCGEAADSTDEPTEPAAAEETTADEAPAATEAQAASPRIAVTYDGGIRILDATTLEEVGDLPLEGFNRLNPAGDGRHLLVSTAGGFQLLDAGTWAEAHGDHSHYYTSEPALTDILFPAEEPGHVVTHAGLTVLFDDATGEVLILDAASVADETSPPGTYTASAPHHGVALALSDGTLVASEGDEDGPTGITVVGTDGDEAAASEECPGLHGAAVAEDEAVVLGCEDGALVYLDGELGKIDSPDDYGRIGNLAAIADSDVVLGDYKTDPDAELERPTRVSLIDTESGELRLVDLPASYSFRSLERGTDGEALVLGTDGAIHVIDAEDGEVTDAIPVVEEWQEPQEWQQPRPALTALDGSVYVTDPATRTVHAVDIESGEVWRTVELDVVPNEIAGVSGNAVGAGGQHDEDDEGHDDGDHDHDHEHDDAGH